MADDGHDAFIRRKFGANRTRIFGCTEVVTPDKLHFLTIDTTGIVNLFRNCTCGSTLMDEFNNRRDLSPGGLKRREKFGALMDRLVEGGMEMETARTELLKVMRGEGSKVLKIKKSGEKYT